jgi:hypothetical protein
MELEEEEEEVEENKVLPKTPKLPPKNPNKSQPLDINICININLSIQFLLMRKSCFLSFNEEEPSIYQILYNFQYISYDFFYF